MKRTTSFYSIKSIEGQLVRYPVASRIKQLFPVAAAIKRGTTGFYLLKNKKNNELTYVLKAKKQRFSEYPLRSKIIKIRHQEYALTARNAISSEYLIKVKTREFQAFPMHSKVIKANELQYPIVATLRNRKTSEYGILATTRPSIKYPIASTNISDSFEITAFEIAERATCRIVSIYDYIDATMSPKITELMDKLQFGQRASKRIDIFDTNTMSTYRMYKTIFENIGASEVARDYVTDVSEKNEAITKRTIETSAIAHEKATIERLYTTSATDYETAIVEREVLTSIEILQAASIERQQFLSITDFEKALVTREMLTHSTDKEVAARLTKLFGREIVEFASSTIDRTGDVEISEHETVIVERIKQIKHIEKDEATRSVILNIARSDEETAIAEQQRFVDNISHDTATRNIKLTLARSDVDVAGRTVELNVHDSAYDTGAIHKGETEVSDFAITTISTTYTTDVQINENAETSRKRNVHHFNVENALIDRELIVNNENVNNSIIERENVTDIIENEQSLDNRIITTQLLEKEINFIDREKIISVIDKAEANIERENVVSLLETETAEREMRKVVENSKIEQAKRVSSVHADIISIEQANVMRDAKILVDDVLHSGVSTAYKTNAESLQIAINNNQLHVHIDAVEQAMLDAKKVVDVLTVSSAQHENPLLIDVTDYDKTQRSTAFKTELSDVEKLVNSIKNVVVDDFLQSLLSTTHLADLVDFEIATEPPKKEKKKIWLHMGRNNFLQPWTPWKTR